MTSHAPLHRVVHQIVQTPIGIAGRGFVISAFFTVLAVCAVTFMVKAQNKMDNEVTIIFIGLVLVYNLISYFSRLISDINKIGLIFNIKYFI